MNRVLYGGYIFLESIIQSVNILIWNLIAKKKKYVVIEIFKGYKYKFIPFGQVIEILYSWKYLPAKRRFEYEVFKEFIKHIKPGDTVIDVGANMGIFTLLASELVGETGRVIAIEASSKNARILNSNLILNNIDNVIVINKAVSNEIHNAYLSDPNGLDGDAMYSISTNSVDGAEEMITTTFDQIVQEYKIENVSIVKIDIEGAELLFFQGAKDFLSIRQPFIIMECYEKFLNRNNHSIFSLLNYLNQFGYEFVEQKQFQWTASKKI